MQSSQSCLCSYYVHLWLLVLGLQVSSSPLLGQFGRTEQHFAQVVVNGGSTTSSTVQNPSDTETIVVGRKANK